MQKQPQKQEQRWRQGQTHKQTQRRLFKHVLESQDGTPWTQRRYSACWRQDTDTGRNKGLNTTAFRGKARRLQG